MAFVGKRNETRCMKRGIWDAEWLCEMIFV